MSDTRSFEKAIYFTKLSVCPALSWPHSRYATKFEILKYDIVRFLSIINALSTVVPIISGIYVYRHNSIAISVAFLSAAFGFVLKLILSRVQCKQWQILIEEMENFLTSARPNEKIILQRYVERFLMFQTSISGAIYMSTLIFVLEPLILPNQRFPFNAIYPFNVDSGIVMYLIYIHQTISLVQVAAGVSIDGQGALIMWFAGARLEILADELADITDVDELQSFIRKHIRLIAYAKKVSDEMSYIVFISATNIAITAVMSAMQLIGNTPFVDKLPAGLSSVVCTIILFVSASPADNLIHVCDLMAEAVYNTSWFDMPMEMTKSLLLVLHRCQRPIIVSFGGLIPTLSLNFYASFLSTLYSCFTAIRIVMTSDK